MERVQYEEEKMIGELRGFVDDGLFTEQEAKQVIRKRRTFEMALVRRVSKKADYLRYVGYEMELEELCRKRMARLKIEYDHRRHHGFVQRQYRLFERALKKFKSDVGLWLEYVERAKTEKATGLVGRILSRAVQVHPDDSRLWILLARHELDTVNSVSGARTVLQRGLRMNAESDELWTAYILLEIEFMDRMKRRFATLGIEDPSEAGCCGAEIVRRAVASAPARVRQMAMWADYVRNS